MQSPVWTNRARTSVSLVGFACALIMVFLWDPATSSLFPPCPFHALTDYHCPGCGSLRATHRLMHGRVWDAFRLNPLMVLSLPLLGYAVLSSRWRRLQIPVVVSFTRQAIWPWTIFVVILLYWGLRNVPVEPFSWLAPHETLPM